MKVAVIGAGPSGIAVAKHLLSNKKFNVVIFERQDSIGGLWNYNENVKKDRKNGNTNPLYKNMRTNIPKHSMGYPDYPFSEDVPTFPHHSAVKEYIMNFAKTFNIIDKVRYETEVVHVVPVIGNEKLSFGKFVKWKVESKKIGCDDITTENFDAIVLCTGIFSKPIIPNIDGIENFKGEILHSKWYNDPYDYKNKTVVILGFGLSAADIVVHLAKECSKVYISRRRDVFNESNCPSNVEIVANINRIDDDGNIVLESERKIFADVLLFCTGYQYDYPYLSPQCQINITENGKVVMPLYKHIFNINYPSMAIVTLRQGGPAFSLIHYQASFVEKVFSRELNLPLPNDMLNETIRSLNQLSTGNPKSFHEVGVNHFGHTDELADITGIEKVSDVAKKIYARNVSERIANIFKYRNLDYHVIDSQHYEVNKKLSCKI